MRFQRTGRTLTWDERDGSLLEFAERHAILVESGCRSGGCGSSARHVLEGTMHCERAQHHDVKQAIACCAWAGPPHRWCWRPNFENFVECQSDPGVEPEKPEKPGKRERGGSKRD